MTVKVIPVFKHHVIRHGGMEVNFHTFLPSALLGGDEWSAYAMVSLSQKHLILIGKKPRWAAYAVAK
jgi:hypothetical protein